MLFVGEEGFCLVLWFLRTRLVIMLSVYQLLFFLPPNCRLGNNLINLTHFSYLIFLIATRNGQALNKATVHFLIEL